MIRCCLGRFPRNIVGKNKARNMRQSFLSQDVRQRGWGFSGPAAIEGTRDRRCLDETRLKLEVEDLLRVQTSKEYAHPDA